MATIKEIINKDRPARDIIADLQAKSVNVPEWDGPHGLRREYDPSLHPVMDRSIYPDVVEGGRIDRVTRVTCNLQQLAVRRMSELCCATPVRRVYSPEDDTQQEVARLMERVFQRNRIDSVNVERLNMLFAGCEVATLWYAVEQPNSDYGFPSPLKLRCRNFSPMRGDRLYPLFDEYGDMVAMSIGYTRRVGAKEAKYFDTYTSGAHYKWEDLGSGWELVEEDDLAAVGKIPLAYMWRPSPIWEHTSGLVYEMEWALSRNGNYLRKNSKPLFVVYADEEIAYGGEKSQDAEFRSILQYPKGSSAGYVTWDQAVENLKFHVSELRQSFFTQLQLPDWSYESMKSTPMSGESRKQLFIDAQLKVGDERGRLLEFFDREVNVVRRFLRLVKPGMEQAVDALPVESVVTPYSVTEDKDVIENLVTANGNKPIMSQRESIARLGWSEDVDETLREIAEESAVDAINPAF